MAVHLSSHFDWYIVLGGHYICHPNTSWFLELMTKFTKNVYLQNEICGTVFLQILADLIFLQERQWMIYSDSEYG